jgi:hypothetical protein
MLEIWPCLFHIFLNDRSRHQVAREQVRGVWGIKSSNKFIITAGCLALSATDLKI